MESKCNKCVFNNCYNIRTCKGCHLSEYGTVVCKCTIWQQHSIECPYFVEKVKENKNENDRKI